MRRVVYGLTVSSGVMRLIYSKDTPRLGTWNQT